MVLNLELMWMEIIVIDGKRIALLYAQLNNQNIRHKFDNIRSISAHNKSLVQVRSTTMDTSVNMDQVKSNSDVKADMTSDDVTHSNDIVNSPNFLRIPLKPIEQRPADELINEKSDVFGPTVKTENIPGTPMESVDALVGDSIDSENDVTPNSSIVNEMPVINRNQHSISNHSSAQTTFINHERKPSIANIAKELSNNENLFSRSSFSSNEDGSNKRPQKQEDQDPESLMFRDGRRKIDMILCYEEESEGVMTELEAKRREARNAFLDNLVKDGLELEIEDKSESFDEKTCFVKIHLPRRSEIRYAEVLNLKLPVKRFITISVKAWDDEKKSVLDTSFWRSFVNYFRKINAYHELIADGEATFSNANANGNPNEQFIVKDRCTSYCSSQRSLMVMQVLLRTKYDDSEKVGIRRLLADGTFLACFPLHEGRYDRPHSSGSVYDRRLLYLTWARPNCWYKKQPLCLVRRYFGDKIALYFCWLGFYTNMLIYPAIVGAICFLYGIITIESNDNIPSKEICNITGPGSITLCPLCDKACEYQKLHDSCLFSRITYLFDNPSTVFFAIFMSFWATTFLEMWKRKQALIVWEWDLQNIEEDEENRPEFEATAKTFRTNPVTKEREPYIPTWTKIYRYFVTASVVTLMILVVLAAVLGTIIYRISVVSAVYSGSGGFLRKHAKIFTTITAATINLIIIMILTRIYHKVAVRLTNMENPRTHTEYEDSFTFKIFFFEFMNYYSSLIYIAFFKGRFYEHPGDRVVRRSEFYRLKGDICDPAGCLSELCIQLAIIMVGKQIWGNCMEYVFPKMYNWWRQRKHKKQTKDEQHLHMAWEEDYHMQDPGRLSLFDEYLEMILQYGFVTLFVAAFPLAPFFALLNNIAEIRIDAFKMVAQARRPLAERAEDIGAWFGVLRMLTYAAVVSNAFVIAYTSDYIPRMVYKYVYSADSSLWGYIDHSLSEFNTSHYRPEWRPIATEDHDICQYRGYRNPPNITLPIEENYGYSPHYWHVFAARLAFVVVFEHIVFIITGLMQFVIPDIPVEVKTQMSREALLAKEAKYQTGLKKSQEQIDYNDVLQSMQNFQNHTSTRQGLLRGSWARRLSRVSDGLDAHVEIAAKPRPKRKLNSVLWEVT
ncbi:anoctamin-5-like isoform X2 [Sitodiplosis mosellana]|uniref:anoctamin-5-like isoform X2 n=1 Tax=Sitodiplosis mosellana TaxID=263140 RepID=UPI00244485C1|nr:anoctamin-5-like isoform X2 [Sitodiplosis mosellana]